MSLRYRVPVVTAWSTPGAAMLITGAAGVSMPEAIGAFLVVTLQNYLAGTQLPVTVVTGVIFVVCVLLFRRGIVGEAVHRLRG